MGATIKFYNEEVQSGNTNFTIDIDGCTYKGGFSWYNGGIDDHYFHEYPKGTTENELDIIWETARSHLRKNWYDIGIVQQLEIKSKLGGKQ